MVLRARLVCLIFLFCSPAAAQDDQRGSELARRWCASCHLVERNAPQARADGIPSFRAIANDRRASPTVLRNSLTGTHARMPNFSLSRDEQDDLIAYILGLRD